MKKVSAIIIIAFCILSILFFFRKRDHDEIIEIEDYFAIDIPENAFELNYSYRMGRGSFVVLNFLASKEDAEIFIESVCSGVLYQGYDPFNAVNRYDNTRNSILINGGDFMYYSYSERAFESIWGNRCIQNGIRMISVDKNTDDQYEVRFEAPMACNRASVTLPCSGQQDNFIIPVHNLPLMIIGLNERENFYYLESRKLCFGFGFGYSASIPERFSYLIGKTIGISIDGEQVIFGEVSSSWTISKKNSLEGDMERYGNAFSNCVERDWQKGIHSIELSIYADSYRENFYIIEFEV